MNSQHPKRFTHFILKRALRTAVALLLALVATYYFSKVSTFWVAVMALLLTQTEMGLPLHQSLQRFFWAVLTFFLGTLSVEVLTTGLPLFLLLTCAAALLAYWYAYTSRRYLSLHFPLLLLIILLLSIVFPVASIDLPYVVADILFGAFIALSCIVLIFPDKPDLEFQKRVQPVLKDFSHYLASLVSLLLQEAEAAKYAQSKRAAVELIWANKDDYFPVWVFEAGFNPALKAGQYYFVVHLGQISEILFAMHHFARHPFERALLQDFVVPLNVAVAGTQDLLENVLVLLSGKKLTRSNPNFIDDILALEEQFRSTFHLSLEMLDLSRDYIYLAAFIRYLKDLRLQLLQLAAALTPN